jgi:hypothetical protein
LAVLGLSCGSSSGEEVATDVVAFQSFFLHGDPRVLAIKKGGDALEYGIGVQPSALAGLKLRSIFLPFVESTDGKFLLLDDLNRSTPVPPSIVRCFHGYVCQTASGDIVDPGSFALPTLRDFPEGRGATTCDGIYCVVGGRAVALDGAKSVIPGTITEVVSVSWVDIGSTLHRGGYAFLRTDGSVATAGYDFENTLVTELVGLPPIRKIHEGGIYEDYSGRMWYVGVAPEGWADNLVPAEVPRQQCKVKVGKKLSLLDVPCVGPTVLPALEGMVPQLIHDNAFIPVLYALDKEGTLHCWSAPGGPACVKGE